jgi:NADPH:quinone reductase-like Zn-dependent oxidoreductase
MVAMGIIELPTPLFGFEAAGVVSRIGPDVKNFTVGDRTVLLGVKTFSTVCTATEKVFEKIPGEMSFIEGASMPLVILTAIYSLIDIGHLEKGQVRKIAQRDSDQLLIHFFNDSLSLSTAVVEVSGLPLSKLLVCWGPRSIRP